MLKKIRVCLFVLMLYYLPAQAQSTLPELETWHAHQLQALIPQVIMGENWLNQMKTYPKQLATLTLLTSEKRE